MQQEMQQKVAECVEHIKDDQVVINRNAHQYQGEKYQEIMERGPVGIPIQSKSPEEPLN